MAVSVTSQLLLTKYPERLPRGMQSFYGRAQSIGAGTGSHQVYFEVDGGNRKYKPWLVLSQVSVLHNGGTISATPYTAVFLEQFERQHTSLGAELTWPIATIEPVEYDPDGTTNYAGVWNGTVKAGRVRVGTTVPKLKVQCDDQGQTLNVLVSGYLADYTLEGYDTLRG